MIYIIYICVLAVFFLVALFVSSSQQDIPLPSELEKEISTANVRRHIFFVRPFSPLNKLILNRLYLYNLIDRRLELADLKTLPEDFLGLCEISALSFSLGAYIFKGSFDFLWVILSGVIGFILPFFYLRRRIFRRKTLILRSFPNVLNLISLCVGAGLDLILSLNWIIERSPVSSPLLDEFAVVLHEINVGQPRRQALRNMAKRLDIPEISSFVRIVVQAEKMGTPIGEALAMYAEEVREMRFERAERQALKAPIKMLFPLVFFILPVVGIIVGGPILIRFMKTGLSGIGQ